MPGTELAKGLRSLATCCVPCSCFLSRSRFASASGAGVDVVVCHQVRDLALGRAVGAHLAEGPKAASYSRSFIALSHIRCLQTSVCRAASLQKSFAHLLGREKPSQAWTWLVWRTSVILRFVTLGFYHDQMFRAVFKALEARTARIFRRCRRRRQRSTGCPNDAWGHTVWIRAHGTAKCEATECEANIHAHSREPQKCCQTCQYDRVAMPCSD